MYIKYKFNGGSFLTPNLWNLQKQREWINNMDWKEKLHHKFVDWFYGITQKRGLGWLDLLVNTLCVLEVNYKLYKDPEFRDDINVAGMQEDEIPTQSLYCDRCKFKTYSKIAKLFYGSQMHGFCYYLNRGDFTYGHYTDLLWDGCKCCGIGIEFDDEDDDYAEYTKE